MKNTFKVSGLLLGAVLLNTTVLNASDWIDREAAEARERAILAQAKQPLSDQETEAPAPVVPLELRAGFA